MGFLVDVFQTTKHDDAVVHGRLVDRYGLESALESGVLLEVLLVLGPRRGRHGPKLTTGEGGLEQVGRIARALRGARADQGMRLVDEQDDRSLRSLDLGDHRLDAVLELAFDGRASLQEPEVESEQLGLLQVFWYVAADDLEGETLGHGRLAHAGFTNDDGVVLPPSAEDVEHLPYLAVSAEDRVDLSVAGSLSEVVAEPIQRSVTGRTARRRATRCGCSRLGAGLGCGLEGLLAR